MIESGEDCDDTGDSPLCDADCTFAECSDGYINAAAGELCDDSNVDDGDGCDADCTASQVAVVSAGGEHTCLLLDTGTVRCWGNADNGAIGYGNTNDVGDDELPSSVGVVDIGGTAVQLAAGYHHNCAVLDDGSVRCWGQGQFAQLGYGDTLAIGDDETPASAGDVSVGGLVEQLATGYFHACVLLDNGDVRCWGAGPEGELGYGNTESIGDDEIPSSVGPVDVGGTVAQLVTGFHHTCALLSTADVRCWGDGSGGRLGYGNTAFIGDDEVPSSVGTVDVGGAVTQLAAGGTHTCAILANGDVRCWGVGGFGQLGYGNLDDIGDDEVPSSVGPVALGGAAVQIVTGFLNTCALLDNGDVRCWGFGDFGGLGYGNTDEVGDDEFPTTVGPVDVGGSVSRISLTNDHVCALHTNANVRCWGLGASGQLGYGSTANIGDDELPAAVGPVVVF